MNGYPQGSARSFVPSHIAPTTTDTVTDLRARLERAERDAVVRQRQLERYAADLRESYRRERARAQQLRRSYKATVRALANAVEARDAYTGKHAGRVAAYGLAIAFAAGVDVADEPQMEFGFLLHDIGKLGVPDAILFKPAALTPDEFSSVADHTEIGYEILRDLDFLDEATQVVRHHHERWDGMGYPDALKGEQIPLAARVFAVADTLDALTTDRPYRAAMGWEQAREEILQAAGTQFDPTVIAAYDTIGDDTFARLSEGVRSSVGR